MLHGTICNDDFSATGTALQVVATSFRKAAALFQHLNPALR